MGRQPTDPGAIINVQTLIVIRYNYMYNISAPQPVFNSKTLNTNNL
jgi:hypothetical protein